MDVTDRNVVRAAVDDVAGPGIDIVVHPVDIVSASCGLMNGIEVKVWNL